MRVREVAAALDEIAPPALAADWDNVGLLLGDPRGEGRRVLLCIDLTEDVLAEAIDAGAKMIVAYHPVLFKPIAQVRADRQTVIWRAIRKSIAVYSPHTALDCAAGGTNDVLADLLDLRDRRPLEPAPGVGQVKIVVFAPGDDLADVQDAAFEAGAGVIGDYHDCSFFQGGTGTFFGGEGTNPTVGQAGRHETAREYRLEMICPRRRLAGVVEAIRQAHSYEEPAIDVVPLEPLPDGLGQGRVGRLAKPASVKTLVTRIKRALGVSRVLIAGEGGQRRVGIAAVGAGSCGSMWQRAADAGASLFLTGEMRHHDALAAAAAGLTVVCVGHSNSERRALSVLADRLRQAVPGIEPILSRRDRDPFEIV